MMIDDHQLLITMLALINERQASSRFQELSACYIVTLAFLLWGDKQFTCHNEIHYH